MKIPIKRKAGSIITALIAVAVGLFFILENTDLFTQPSKPVSNPSGSCSVHFIDVGQGDSTLICAGDETILIDAGENNKGDEVLLYLSRLGIERLDYVIGTHAHSDHIGGLDTVINGIEVENIILSDLPEKMVPTTKTYTDLLEAIQTRNVNLIVAEPKDTYNIGGGVLTLLAPVDDDYKDLNDFSVVSRFDYGSKSILITGDAEEKAEKDIMQSGAYLNADILKVGHHGSDTSSSRAFLEAVSPEVAVIHVGAGNKYGHPMAETFTKLSSLGAKYYRTDLNGSVVVTINGDNIEVTCEKE